MPARSPHDALWHRFCDFDGTAPIATEGTQTRGGPG